MSKPLNKLKRYFFQSSSSNLSTHYLTLIENILNDSTKTNLEKQEIIRKILKLITNKIQIHLNEAVLFHGISEQTHKVSHPIKTLPFEFTDYPKQISPQPFTINKVPFFSYIWRDDRIIKTFSIIGKEGFEFQKQDNPENVIIYPLGIVVGFGNNHSSNAGLLDNSTTSRANYTLTLTAEQLSSVLSKPETYFECEEVKLLLEIAQLFIDSKFTLEI